MKHISIKAPDGKTLDLSAPDDATPAQIHQAAANAASHYQQTLAAATPAQAPAAAPAPAPTPASTTSQLMSAIGKGVDATPGLGQLKQLTKTVANMSPELQKAAFVTAGSELGMTAGPMASAAGAAAGGTMAEVAQNPETAARVMTPIVKTALSPTPANVADTVKQVGTPEAADFMKRRAIEAGTALVAGGALKAVRGVTAEGPFSAAMENPSLVSGSVRDKILKELGASKAGAMAGEDLAEGGRLMRLLRTPGGQGRVADEAIQAVHSGTLKDATNTQLMAFDEALGKTQTKGGTFSHIYKGARDAVRAQLSEQAPTVMANKAAARKVFLSLGEGDAATSLIKAIQNPVSSAATMPGAQRILGATTRVASEGLFPGFVGSADMLASSLQNLSSKRKNGRGK